MFATSVNPRKTTALFLLIILFALLSLAIGFNLSAAQATQADLFLDLAWYRDNLIGNADKWNGGLDGESGMGAYRDDFDGFFHVNLDQQWNQTPMFATTAVAQSRAIYMNVEAYRAAGPSEGERFLDAAVLGADYLLEHFWDEEHSGFFWMLSPQGRIVDDMKQGYGNVHPMFALAHVYSITHDPIYLEAALTQLEVLQEHFYDPAYPGAMLPGFNRDFSRNIGVNNVDAFTHLFEALLALYDVTEGAQQEAIAELIALHGNFLVNHLYHDQAGYDDRGYVAYNYDEAWQPSQIPYSRDLQWAGAMHATTGHNIELAYLISRAVERGFDASWLTVADKLIRFCMEYAIDPEYGGMIYDTTDYEGQPLVGNPDNDIFVWWPQAETARALLHFTVVRDQDYIEEFRAVETLFNDFLTDPVYGGLYHGLDIRRDLAPVGVEKGDIWKVNYHYTMFFSEVLRLGQEYPDRIAELNSSAAPA